VRTSEERTQSLIPYGSRIFNDTITLMKTICQFSCGAASAVATKITLEENPDAIIVRCDTGSEHPDNERFMRDCEEWFGKKVQILKSKDFNNIWEVFDKRQYLAGIGGAPCTSEMKRIPGMEIWNLGDVEVFGYTVEETHRVERFRKNNNERIIKCPLIEKGFDKADCLGMLERAGIDLPVMYSLGFRNNNCLGCVKAQSVDYWKRIRKHFPDKFEWYALKERELNHAINRVTVKGVKQAVFLDEIEEGDPKQSDPDISCGLFCMAEADNFNS